MFNLVERQTVNVTKQDRLEATGTSKGNQLKWYANGKFIKQNTWEWYEDVSEVLVSHLLKFSNIDYFVEYYPCTIIEDGIPMGNGCFSYNFLQDGEQDITFYRLAKNLGMNVSNATFDDIRDELSAYVGFDLKGYMGKSFCLDAMVYNEDRHLNNLSVIKTPTGYRESPIYDNGLACLSDVFSYPLSRTLEDNLQRVYAKPFNTDFKAQITQNYICPISFDSKSFLNSVKPENDLEQRALDVIRQGLQNTGGIAWEEYWTSNSTKKISSVHAFM